MARIRTIKPEFWKHPVMARLPDDIQLLALALLSMADDHGYFHADPSIVRGEVMPFRESLANISRSIAKLSEVGWIEVWSHPEQGDIGIVAKWSDHQKVDHPRDSKLKRYDIRESLAKDSRKSRDVVALDQGSGIREVDQGMERAPVEEIDPTEVIGETAKSSTKPPQAKTRATGMDLLAALGGTLDWFRSRDGRQEAEGDLDAALILARHDEIRDAVLERFTATGSKIKTRDVVEVVKAWKDRKRYEINKPPDPIVERGMAVARRLGPAALRERYGFQQPSDEIIMNGISDNLEIMRELAAEA